MDRNSLLRRLDESQTSQWDIAIIGGGAVGLGTALDAAARGHTCVLFEQHDFCKGTSSRSTKLIHGGVRYLAQGDVSLVREALHERERLFRNAPSLVHPLRFIIPCYSDWERWYYWTGLKCYDGLAGRLGIRASRAMKNDEVEQSLPGLRVDRLRGGVAYFDAQFDDAKLGVSVARKCHELGALPLNYVRVRDFLKDGKHIEGIQVVDEETGRTFQIHAKAIINATGAFSDTIRQLEDPDLEDTIAPSQGIHLVVDQSFLGASDALMIPKTSDNRVLFAIPWLGRAILGTTDTPVSTASLEPQPLDEEVDYLLRHFSPYLRSPLNRTDVLSMFAGLRPLVKPSSGTGETSKISREHRVIRSAGGLISILGGKWTTFRTMAADVVDEAEIAGQLRKAPCATENLSLETDGGSHDLTAPDAGPSREQVEHALREEFARTVEDVLARRFRCLFLDARNSMELAPRIAAWIAETLGQPPEWIDRQVRAYEQMAEKYLID